MSKDKERVILSKVFGRGPMYYSDHGGNPCWVRNILEADKLPRRVVEEFIRTAKLPANTYTLLDASVSLVAEVLES